MEQYISKSALVAEIERLYDEKGTFYAADVLYNLKEWLDTLEVKEVDEPTAADRGMAEEIIINLKRVEQDYCINLTKEMKWLRNKAQKGEKYE